MQAGPTMTTSTAPAPGEGGFTPGPWSYCGSKRNEPCSCGQVWCRDYPVAIVTRGEWGDGLDVWRALREAWDHLRHRGFGFMAYGRVSDELANANVRLTASAPDLLEALRETERLISSFGDLDHDPEMKAGRDKARAAIAKALSPDLSGGEG